MDEQATRLILELPAADASGVARARQAATSHAKQLGLDEDIQERVRLAVTEACANCVLHAYDGSGQAGGRAVGGSNPFAPMNERPAFAGLSRSCSQLEASLWFYGSHESHWFQLAGDSSAPRSLERDRERYGTAQQAQQHPPRRSGRSQGSGRRPAKSHTHRRTSRESGLRRRRNRRERASGVPGGERKGRPLRRRASRPPPALGRSHGPSTCPSCRGRCLAGMATYSNASPNRRCAPVRIGSIEVSPFRFRSLPVEETA